MLVISPLSTQPATAPATGAARESWRNGSVASVVTPGGSARVVLTMTNATANRATIALNGAAVSILARPISSYPTARARNVPTM